MSFGENVRRCRVKSGMTQGELAEKSNLALGQISKIERDLGNPTLNTIESVLKGLQCNASELFDDHSPTDRHVYLETLIGRVTNLDREGQEAIMTVLHAMITAKNMNDMLSGDMHDQDVLIGEERILSLAKEKYHSDHYSSGR